MNILFICDEYPPGRNGGIGSSVQTLARELVKQGHHVVVAGLYSFQYGQADYENDHGVEVFRLRHGIKLPVKTESRIYNLIDKLPGKIKQHLNGKKAYLRFLGFINDLLVNEKIDIIEIADYNNFCQHLGFVVKWPRFKVPLILKSHGSHTYFSEELNVTPDKILLQSDHLLFERADAHAAVSHYTAQKNKLLFRYKGETKVLYNGIDLKIETPGMTRDSETAVFTGSIAPKKGIFSLISAWNEVHKKMPGAKLFILGKGKTKPLRNFLTAEAASSVIFTGHVAKPVLNNYLSKATLAVFPSYSETFGLGVVEAMSAGCPVIYTKRSCGPEIVKNDVEGLLVDPDDIPEIAGSIVELFEDTEKRTRFSTEALRSVKKKFDIVTLAEDHIQFYKDVIRQFKT